MRLTSFAAPILTVGLASALTFSSISGVPVFSGAKPANRAAGKVRNPENGQTPPAQQGQQGQQQDQQNKQPQAQQPLKIQVNLVNVFATVRDKHTGSSPT